MHLFHRHVNTSVTFVFTSVRFGVAGEKAPVPDSPAGEWHLYCGPVLSRAVVAMNADERSLWGSGWQPGLLAEEKSITPSIATRSHYPACLLAGFTSILSTTTRTDLSSLPGLVSPFASPHGLFICINSFGLKRFCIAPPLLALNGCAFSILLQAEFND